MGHQDNSLKRSYAIFFVFTTAVLGILGIMLCFLPQKTYSENENRYLTTFQPVSLSGFLDTSVQENLTSGANDQFWERDWWMKVATGLQRMTGFRDAGGVYFGKNGYYFERILDSQLSDDRYMKNLHYLEEFTARHKTATVFLPVPSAGTILKEQLPEYAVLYDDGQLFQKAGQLMKQTTLLDIRSELADKSRTDQIYFKTDHHWTMKGAYLAYAALCRMHGTDPGKLSDFSPECVSRTFLGTLYSKAPVFATHPDEFWLPRNTPPADILVNSKKADGIYDWEKLQTKDKYGVYFGGNFGRIDIRPQTGRTLSFPSDHGNTETKLLLVKDSFANSLVPFLMNYYSEIIMLDLRYYNESLTELMQTERPSEVLVLYEISNFAQDMNFFKILK